MKKYVWFVVIACCSLLPFAVHGQEYSIQNEWIPGVYAMKYQGSKYFYGPMSYLTLNGKIGYCLDPYLLLGERYERDDTVVFGYPTDQQAYFQLLAYYASLKGGSRYYLAAQELMWRAITNDQVFYTTENIGAGDPISVEAEKNELVAWTNQMMEGPRIPSTLTGKVFETKTWIDENGVLDQYTVVNRSHHQVEIKDHVLIVTFLDDQPANVELVYRTPGETEGYRNNGFQNVAFFGGYEKQVSLTLEPEDSYRLKLNLHHTFDDRDVSGTFRFQIRDLQTGMLVEQNGRTIFETYLDGTFLSDFSLEKGNYQLEYLSASEPFLCPDNQLFGVSYDERTDSILELSIPVSVPQGTIQLVRTQMGNLFENTIRMQGVEYMIFSATDFLDPFGEGVVLKDTSFGTFFTDGNGYVVIPNLPLGSYYLLETCPDQNCVAMSKPILFDVFYVDDRTSQVVCSKQLETSFLPKKVTLQLEQEHWLGFLEEASYDWIGMEDQVSLFALDVVLQGIPFWEADQVLARFQVQNGKGIFTADLPKGTYLLRTRLGDLVFEVTEEDSIFLKQRQFLDKGTIEIAVTNETGEGIANVPLQLRHKEQVISLVTGKNGSVFLYDLPYGTYQLTDFETNELYELRLNQEYLLFPLVRKELPKEEPPKEDQPDVPKEEPPVDPDVDLMFPETLPDTHRTNFPSGLFLFVIGYYYQKTRH